MRQESKRDLYQLAWPAVLAMVAHHVYRLNDQYFAQALQVAFDNALIGADCTLPVMINSGTMNSLRVPLAHLFAVVL